MRLWLGGEAPAAPPYGVGPGDLFVAYYASAELGCHLALGWHLPVRVLDLYAEFKRLTSGLGSPLGNGLLGALAYFGLDGLAAAEKESMRQLAMRGGPYPPAERVALLGYCASGVDALARLLPAMLPRIDLPRAQLRGRYVAAAARMEWAGVPIDLPTLGRLREHWVGIQGRLIEAVDADFGVYEGRSFREDRFGAYLRRRGIAGPVLPMGRLALAHAFELVRARLPAARQGAPAGRHRLVSLEARGVRVFRPDPGVAEAVRRLAAGEVPRAGRPGECGADKRGTPPAPQSRGQRPPGVTSIARSSSARRS